MGGIAIILSTLLGYFLAHLISGEAPTASGILVLFMMVGIGFVGFLDDWTKIKREDSGGLSGRQKVVGQTVVAIVFAILASLFSRDGVTPASHHVSFVRDTGLDLAVLGTGVGIVLFVIWTVLITAAASNGVNLTDGLDGQAAGASIMVFGAYVLISLWQLAQSCASGAGPGCYEVRDPSDLALVALCIACACVGFLWWNTPPADLFMGDTGSLGLGGALAAIAILSRTELLLILLGGLFVFETVTVILQTSYFKATKRRNGGVGKRLFRMTPIHHHFEMLGWRQITVSIRFWMICFICVGAGLGVFYMEWFLRQ
jgi:phospho-N-acetylmuramoyl-pentapeptide-transferase